MKKILLPLLAGLAAVGCATVNQPLSATTAAELKGQAIVQTSHPTPPFTAMTPGKAMLGVFGAAAMISEGNGIVSNNHVADPALGVSSSLSDALVASRGVTLVTPAVVTTSEDAAAIAALAPVAARYVLDVQTSYWNFAYIPTMFGRYRVTYWVRGRLIDTRTKAVVAESTCKHVPESDASAPTYDELVANDAAVLKHELALAATACTATIKSAMLAL